MRIIRNYRGGPKIVQVGRFAISCEKNHPIYEKKWGVRILRPFAMHGAGLHLGGLLIHLHTNRQPLYGQP